MADKILSIGLGANTSGLKKDMDNAAAIVKSAGQQMGDAVSQSSDKISSSSKKAGENLQQAYRAAAKDARQAALQFGETSDRFRIAAQTAGELKDRLDLTNQTIKAFSSDAPVLSATVGVMQSMAGAFSAAQGAAALFGSEGKALQETMLKVQAAMALTQGLTALTQAGDAFMALKTVIMVQVIPAITSIGVETAIATGGLTLLIGALVALSVETMGETKKSQETYIALTMAEAKSQASLNTAIQDSISKQKQLSLLQAEATGDKNILAKEKAKQEYESKVDANRKMFMESQKNTFDEMRYRDTLTALNKIYKNNIAEIDKGILEDKKKANTGIIKANQEYLSGISALTKGQSMAINIEKNIKYTGGFQFKTPSLDAAQIMPKFDLNKIKAVLNQDFKNMQEYLHDKSEELAKSLNQMLSNGISNGLASVFSKIGENLGKGSDPFANVGAVLFQSLGGLMEQVGSAMIAWGVAQEAFFKSLFAGPAGGVTAIAAGIGLVVAGAALSSAFSGAQSYATTGVSSGGNSAPSAGTFGNGGNNYNYGVLQVGGQIRGNNLLVSVNRSGYERSRVR